MKIILFFLHLSCDSSRLKRQSSKLSTPEILAMLEMYEANERNRYGNENDDSMNFDNYRKPLFVPSSTYVNPDDETSDGEWWNELLEPSIQYYGNPPNGHAERSPYQSNWKHHFHFIFQFICLKNFHLNRFNLASAKRFMVSKKKRSLGLSPSDAYKSKIASGFDSRYRQAWKFWTHHNGSMITPLKVNKWMKQGKKNIF